MTKDQIYNALSHAWRIVTRTDDYAKWQCQRCNLYVKSCGRGMGCLAPVGNLCDKELAYDCNGRQVAAVMES